MLTEKILDRPAVWEASRSVFEFALSLYRKRRKLMNDWLLLAENPSVLDVGCGTGHYAGISSGSYLGIDLNERYIEYAIKKNKRSSRRFQVMNVTELCEQDKRFDVVLMVDILHHITNAQCKHLLVTASKIARQYVVSFEPIADQTNAVGSWMIRSDRGKHMRSVERLSGLLREADLNIVKQNELLHGRVYRTAAFLCSPRKMDF